MWLFLLLYENRIKFSVLPEFKNQNFYVFLLIHRAQNVIAAKILYNFSFVIAKHENKLIACTYAYYDYLTPKFQQSQLKVIKINGLNTKELILPVHCIA